MSQCPTCYTEISNPQARTCPECGEELFQLTAPDPDTGKQRRINSCHVMVDGLRCPRGASVTDAQGQWCSLHANAQNREAETRAGIAELIDNPRAAGLRMGGRQTAADLVAANAAQFQQQEGETEADMIARCRALSAAKGYKAGRVDPQGLTTAGNTPTSAEKRERFLARSLAGLRQRYEGLGFNEKQTAAALRIVELELREQLGLNRKENAA